MSYYVYLNKLLLPVAPTKIKTKVNNKNTTISLIEQGEVNLIKTQGLTEISFECMIPRFKYPFAQYKGGKFQAPPYFLTQIEKLKERKTPFRFMISRYQPGLLETKKKKFVVSGVDSLPVLAGRWQDTNMMVTLEDYEITEDAENGMDYMVSINLKEYRNYGTQKLAPPDKKDDTKRNLTEIKGSLRNTKDSSKDKAYVVKSGDTLWGIAKVKLGNGAKHTQIYNLNKAVIEKAAKAHGRKSSSKGHWIYPGTKLKLPT